MRRALIAGGGGSFPLPTIAYSMLFNTQVGDGLVSIHLATSTDTGVTWTRYGLVIPRGAGGTWDDEQVHGPSLNWDGSQWVVYYSGYNGTNYRIGRATSPDLITWTKYASNPVLDLGSGFDAAGVIGPVVRYDPDASPPWQMWYTGKSAAAVFTLGYADSTNGLAWSRRGQVLGLGSAGAFDDVSVGGGAVVKVGALYYVFYAGSSETGSFPLTRPGYATCTDPASSGTYTRQGQLAGLTGNVTSLDDGLVYTSNNLTSIEQRGAQWVGFGTAFQPTPDIGQHEVTFRTSTFDLTGTWTTPTGVLLPLAGGPPGTISAENPSVVVTP